MGAWGLGIFENDIAQDVLCDFHSNVEAMAKDFYNDNKESVLELYEMEYCDDLIYEIINTMIDRGGGNVLNEYIEFKLTKLRDEEKWHFKECIIVLAKLEWMILGSVSHKDEVIKTIKDFIDNFLENHSVRDNVSKEFRKANKDDVKEYQKLLDNIINNIPPKKLKSYKEAILEATGSDIIKLFVDSKKFYG